MAELLLELYSEEIPPQLQINARNQLKLFLEKSFNEMNIDSGDILTFSSPTRLTLYIKDLPTQIKTAEKEVRGPKVDSENKIIEESF